MASQDAGTRSARARSTGSGRRSLRGDRRAAGAAAALWAARETPKDRHGYRAFRICREAIEDHGILVLQDGSLNLDEMRGFAAPHDEVPAIVINTKDDVRARLFTLIHELSHLVWANRTEDRHENFSAATLMPELEFSNDFHAATGSLLERVDQVAHLYATTPDATAVRVGWLDLAPWADVNKARGLIRERWHPSTSKGGNPYRNVVARLGPGSVRRVLGAVDQSAMSELAAARLLGVRVGRFPQLRTELRRPDVA